MTQDTTLPAEAWPYPPYQSATESGTPGLPFVDRVPERTAAVAIVATLIGGLLAQVLFFGHAFGLNAPLWIAFVLGAAFVARRDNAQIDRRDLWLPVAALLFAAFIALRDDAMLFAFDLAAASTLTLASVVAIGGVPVSRTTGWALVRLAGRAAVLFWIGAPLISSGFGRLRAAAGAHSRNSLAWRLLRGALIALPLVLCFVALFAAADAVFGAYLNAAVAIEIDSSEIVQRLLFAALAGWLLAGTIAGAWLTRASSAPATVEKPSPRGLLGDVEAATVLVTLNLVFGIFVLVQAAYLFGGTETLTVSGLTYSDYARRGFFELIAVAALAGTVLLILGRVVSDRTRLYRALAAGLAALTGMVLLSALFRVGLYQAAYGWTELRFYAVAAILWLAIGVGAMLVAIALDRVAIVPRAMFAAGLLIAIGCNLVGPQAFVTQQNLNRAVDPTLIAEGGHSGLDVGYLSWLGADSLIVLEGTVDRLPQPERDRVAALLRRRGLDLEARTGDWPSWNLARQSAREALIAR